MLTYALDGCRGLSSTHTLPPEALAHPQDTKELRVPIQISATAQELGGLFVQQEHRSFFTDVFCSASPNIS